jgi:uncharacterized Fe-S center protein
MEKSKVYFTDFRSRPGDPLTNKLRRLMITAGIKTIDFDGKFVAIKMHFGELGNLSYLRPNYAKAVADLVKELGGKPFLTDCNTLYPRVPEKRLGASQLAPKLNGFNETTTGCHVIIGDGVKGTDDVAVPVHNGVYCKEAYIGRAVMDADIFISLTHFKGHEEAGFWRERSKTSAWAAVLGQASAISTLQGKPKSTRVFAAGAVVARKSAEAMRSPIRMAKRISI